MIAYGCTHSWVMLGTSNSLALLIGVKPRYFPHSVSSTRLAGSRKPKKFEPCQCSKQKQEKEIEETTSVASASAPAAPVFPHSFFSDEKGVLHSNGSTVSFCRVCRPAEAIFLGSVSQQYIYLHFTDHHPLCGRSNRTKRTSSPIIQLDSIPRHLFV